MSRKPFIAERRIEDNLPIDDVVVAVGGGTDKTLEQCLTNRLCEMPPGWTLHRHHIEGNMFED